MSGQDTLRLDKLTLKNFRCFAECEIELHPELTVLVADNGQGKTALLDAIAVALEPFVDIVAETRQYRGVRASDVHIWADAEGRMRAAPAVELNLRATVLGAETHWTRWFNAQSGRAYTRLRDAAELLAATSRLRDSLSAQRNESEREAVALPVVAFYRTNRMSNSPVTREYRRASDTYGMFRTDGYLGCLATMSYFREFVGWYRAQYQEAQNTLISGTRRGARPELVLASIHDAISKVLAPSGWGDLTWGEGLGELVARHPVHGTLPLSLLSDGVRSMIALTADLAHRCARLNPQFDIEAAWLTPGVVLIDEVDMHLHPGWQQVVIGLLRATFPNIQFIVTTHSPQVLSTVDVESIRVLYTKKARGDVKTPKYQTRGVESADVLAVIMGIDPIPQVPEARMVSEYQALISDGKGESDEGLKLRAKLLDHFGAQHPIMVNCDRLLRFQAFKLRRPVPPSSEEHKT